MTERITNTATGFVHHDKYTGTKDELLFYRVMPTDKQDGDQKLFFDSHGEFEQWHLNKFKGKPYYLIPGYNPSNR